jgi:hypothetical protein
MLVDWMERSIASSQGSNPARPRCSLPSYRPAGQSGLIACRPVAVTARRRRSRRPAARRAMEHVLDHDARRPSRFFFLPPTVGAAGMPSPDLERVRFARDEMANLVWAVEKN